jgi:hypothetical protein
VAKGRKGKRGIVTWVGEPDVAACVYEEMRRLC